MDSRLRGNDPEVSASKCHSRAGGNPCVMSLRLSFLKRIYLYLLTNNTSDIFSVVSGMSLRNSRNRRRIQVSGNRCAHSRNNRLSGPCPKTVRTIVTYVSLYFFLLSEIMKMVNSILLCPPINKSNKFIPQCGINLFSTFSLAWFESDLRFFWERWNVVWWGGDSLFSRGKPSFCDLFDRS